MGAGEVIELGGGEKYLFRAPEPGGLGIIKHEIVRENVRLLHARRPRRNGEQLRRALHAVDRQELGLRLDLMAEVCLAVKVDGEARDQREILSAIDKPRLDALLRAHDESAGDAERTVKPRRKQRAAVDLHIQPLHAVRGGQLRRVLELQDRRIAVAPSS